MLEADVSRQTNIVLTNEQWCRDTERTRTWTHFISTYVPLCRGALSCY